MLTNNTYKTFYRSYYDDIDKDFMIPSYAESCRFDRGVGYFSLHSLTLCIEGVIGLIRNNGKIRLVCNPDLSSDDIKLIELGETIGEIHITKDLQEQLRIQHPLNELEASKMDVVCNMISDKKLEIRIAFARQGIYHEKFGIFTDTEGNMVYYTGSLNETPNAYVKNLESIVVLQSWGFGGERKQIEQESIYFEKLWRGDLDDLCVIPFPIVVQEDLFNKYKKSGTYQEALEKYYSMISSAPKRTLYEFQRSAIQEFVENDFWHFYEMATGTGKTFTSVKTIKRLIEETDEKLFVIICVPQIDLQGQWKNALEAEGFDNIFMFGGQGSDNTTSIQNAFISYKTKNRTIIAVSVFDTFFSKVYKSCKLVPNLFLIVDEAHNISPVQYRKMPDAKFRLGLSATIQRFHDAESAQIVSYFTGDRIRPYYYGLEDAISSGFLSHYLYYPIFISLTEEEFEKYQRKTKQISIILNLDEDKRDKEELEKLRRERSVIVKQASNKKLKLFQMSRSNEFDFHNAVVYCGQGKEDEEPIIDAVTRQLNGTGLRISQFTSKTENRQQVLREFESGFYDTLVAIKCFDEGVDVPKLDKIYIMASDSAVRQTVQRRGRVLRLCKETGKDMAYIYDMVTLPPDGVTDGLGVRSLIINEFIRAEEYSRLSDNEKETSAILDGILTAFGINKEEINNERNNL